MARQLGRGIDGVMASIFAEASFAGESNRTTVPDMRTDTIVASSYELTSSASWLRRSALQAVF
eukprot:6185382-Pleurochrysis_carterae.AAC.1